MRYVFLCHAPADADAARELGAWLELNTPCRIEYSECGAGCADDLVEAAEQAMTGEAVVLLLSPASAPEKWVRSRWEPVLIGQPSEGGAPLACLVLEECRFPELLRRRDCFSNGLPGRRALKRWLLTRHPQVVSLPHVGEAEGAEAELEDLRRRLADGPGSVAGVPRDVALAFAHACSADFEGAVWVDGTRRSATGISADLAHALGLALDGPLELCQERLGAFCEGRRLLVVFDNCAAPLPGIGGRSSVLRTAAHAGPPPLALAELARVFAVWTELPELCLDALRDVPAAVEGHSWSEVREIASSAMSLLGHRQRAAELLELAELVLPRAAAAGDAGAVRRFEWERGWILQAWGHPGPVVAPVMPPAPGDQLPLPFPITG